VPDGILADAIQALSGRCHLLAPGPILARREDNASRHTFELAPCLAAMETMLGVRVKLFLPIGQPIGRSGPWRAAFCRL